MGGNFVPRRTHATLLVAVLAFLACPSAAAIAADAGVPPPVTLTTGWQFKPDPQIKGTTVPLTNWEATGGWRPITVPHVFDPRPLASEFHGTVGWYRLAFTAPPAQAGFGWAFQLPARCDGA